MPPAHVTLRPAWQPTPPAKPSAPPGAHSVHYDNPTAPPGDITHVAATVQPRSWGTWGTGTWAWEVTIHTTTATGTTIPLYPYSGWGGTSSSHAGARRAATRRARALVRCASQGLPVP